MSDGTEPAAGQAGFTLVEVLVALVIVAIALAAAVRAAGMMTQGNALLRDRSIALVAAQTRMAELRLAGPPVPGSRITQCDQGALQLRCEETVRAASLPRLMSVRVIVSDRQHEKAPLAEINSLLPR